MHEDCLVQYSCFLIVVEQVYLCDEVCVRGICIVGIV